MEKIVERFARHFDVTLRLDRERTLVNGRADAVYNRLVIEYEPPRSLRALNSARTNQHAIGQIRQYMEELEKLDRHRKERLAGVVLDGGFFIFARFRDEHWHIDDPVAVNVHSTETFLRYLLSLSTELALTPENLVRDFGENSNVARRVLPALYKALTNTQHPKVKVLFQQWLRQFAEITGYEKESARLDIAGLAKAYAVPDGKPSAERLFFALHSYYAVFIKLLAVQVAQYYLMPKLGTGLAAVANEDGEGLRRYLVRMEDGGLLGEFGIRNFLEGDFFRWYLDIWDEALEQALRRLVGDLGNYSLVTLDVDPEETRDLLKQLYQNLMPRRLRHALGEYYTPDWLADRLLNQLGYQGDPARRLLDPACGSGTFLVLAIRRIRGYAQEKLLPEGTVLGQILDNVVGYDLNPLAVISARTDYLLALGDLLQYRQGDINIPVYLCDSILTPSQGDDLFTQGGYTFGTAVGRFSVPRALVSAERIDRFAALLEESVAVDLPVASFEARLASTFGDLAADQVSIASALYGQLGDLERQEIDGVWARIIKNAFAPLFQGRFDYVAGNPPWVNWESLPEDYRQDTIPMWHYQGMVPPGGLKSIMGSSKMDISMLMTYAVMDNYLHDRGKLGYVITQSVFKTAGAGQSFRRFRLGSGAYIAPIVVDDMAALKPFEGASNRTSILILERNRQVRYPVSYSVWHKPEGGRTIPENLSLAEITDDRVAAYWAHVAQPIDASDPTSPWITGRRGALKAILKVIGSSIYQAHAGAYTGGANAVYWVEIVGKRPDGLVVVSNITAGAKRKVDDVQAAIEPDLLYPLLRGRDVRRWAAQPSAYIIMTKPEECEEKAIPEDRMQVEYPKTYAYLHHFREALGQRRDAVLMRSAGAIPFYSIGAVNDYTFASYKVVWREQASCLTAAVVSASESKATVPDHKLMLVACQVPMKHTISAVC